MHSVEGAAAAVIERVRRLASEQVSIREAHRRIAAIDLIAPRALPGFDNSAMDGYAVRAADLPGTFPVVATVGAGQVMQTEVPERAAVRIFTGAPMPAGLDTVEIKEDAEAEQDHVKLPEQKLGENVRRIGEDIAEGDPFRMAALFVSARDLVVVITTVCNTDNDRDHVRAALASAGVELELW